MNFVQSLPGTSFRRRKRFVPHRHADPVDTSFGRLRIFFGLLCHQARVSLGALVFADLPYALGTVYLH
jgi:hypothetical protein